MNIAWLNETWFRQTFWTLFGVKLITDCNLVLFLNNFSWLKIFTFVCRSENGKYYSEQIFIILENFHKVMIVRNE